MICQQQYQFRIQLHALFIAQSAMCVHQHLIKIIRLGNVSFSVERHDLSVASGAGEGVEDLVRIQFTPARADVLIGAEKIIGAGFAVVALRD
jgi:hypothetical protein